MLREKIKTIEDFPIRGVKFYDISGILEDRDAFAEAITQMAAFFASEKIDKVAGIEARGFVFSGALALLIGTGTVMIRKRGKLPGDKIQEQYALEYGKATIEIQKDSIKKDENILLVDDLLATGGTVKAAVKLIERLKGNVVGVVSLIEIEHLDGKKDIKNFRSVIKL